MHVWILIADVVHYGTTQASQEQHSAIYFIVVMCIMYEILIGGKVWRPADIWYSFQSDYHNLNISVRKLHSETRSNFLPMTCLPECSSVISYICSLHHTSSQCTPIIHHHCTPIIWYMQPTPSYIITVHTHHLVHAAYTIIHHHSAHPSSGTCSLHHHTSPQCTQIIW